MLAFSKNTHEGKSRKKKKDKRAGQIPRQTVTTEPNTRERNRTRRRQKITEGEELGEEFGGCS